MTLGQVDARKDHHDQRGGPDEQSLAFMVTATHDVLKGGRTAEMEIGRRTQKGEEERSEESEGTQITGIEHTQRRHI